MSGGYYSSFFFFFFSSRRRHTRFDCDWSSDVCSSDLVQTNSVYVTFPLASDTARQLVIWTTTPWTLLANVAVAVHPDIEYGEWEIEGVRYIAAAQRAGDVHVHGKPLAQAPRVAGYPGRDLVGQKYVRPLEIVPLPQEGQRAVIVAGAVVSADEGTGLGPMAPPFGAAGKSEEHTSELP